MPPRESQFLPFQVTWSSLRCDEFPPTNLMNLGAASSNSNNNNSYPPTFFQTDKVTDRIVVRLDFQQNVFIGGAVVSSSSASHISIRTANLNTIINSESGGGFCVRGQEILEPNKQFLGPLAHRARLNQLRETGQARPTPIKMRLESVLTPAYKRKKFAGGDMQKYKEMVAASEKRGEYDPPHWVRYVDVDIRGLWEPHQKLGLDFLTFVGYVVSEEEIQDYNEKVARIKNDYETLVKLQLQQQAQQQQKEKENNNNNNSSPSTLAGKRRERQQEVKKEIDEDDNKLLINLPKKPENSASSSSPPKPLPKIAAKPAVPVVVKKEEENINIEWENINNNNSETKIEKEIKQEQNQHNNNAAIVQHQNQNQNVKQEEKEASHQKQFSDKPLTNVIFGLSGYQNPSRSQIRDKAVKLGAKYSDTWTKNCTHLICAVSGTPKYSEVQASGHGKIVRKEWVDDCELYGELCNETQYVCGDGGPSI